MTSNSGKDDKARSGKDDKARKALDQMRRVQGRATYRARMDPELVDALAVGHSVPEPTSGKAAPTSLEPCANVVVLTCLDAERVAVCSALGLRDRGFTKGEGNFHWRGELALPHGDPYQIVVVQASDTGQANMARSAVDAVRLWAPQLMIHLGLAASTRPGHVKLGDVVIGRSVYHYDGSRVTVGELGSRPKIVVSDPRLIQKVLDVGNWDIRIPVARPDNSDILPEVHVGVIASGEKIVASDAVREAIASGHQSILALDMEGVGFRAAAGSGFDEIPYVDILGISDDGFPSKGQDWRGYAAAAAAQIVKRLLLQRPIEPSTSAALALSRPGGAIQPPAFEEFGRFLAAQDWNAAASGAIRMYGADILSYISNVVDDPDATNDIYGAFLEQMWQRLREFKPSVNLRAWMFMNARAALSRYYRDPFRRRRHHMTEAQEELVRVAKEQQDLEQETSRSESLERIREQLNPEDRELLVLYFDRELPWHEISKILEISPESARHRLIRIKAKIRRLVETR